jgi:hypothetical protein
MLSLEDNMDKQTAISKYLMAQSKAQEVIARIELWDENKTLKENATLLNCKYMTARTLGMKFKLHLKHSNHAEGVRMRTRLFRRLAERGWKNREICETFSLSKQRVYQIICQDINWVRKPV